VTHQLVVCADYVTSWANTYTQYKENIGALLVASKDIGLKVYAERARHICSYVINRMQDKITP